MDGLNGEDNRIIDLQSGTEQVLTDPNGASGHSDMGFGYLIAEDNFNRLPGAVRRWNLSLDMSGGQPATVAGQGDLVYQLVVVVAAASGTSPTATREPDSRSISSWRAPATPAARRCRASTRSSASGSTDRSRRWWWRRT